MRSKQLLRYENLQCKVNFKYKTSILNILNDDFDIIDLKDIHRETRHCFGEEQYIKSFIEVMKEKVIKKLPKLNKVKIMLGVFDKNNMWHRFIVTTINMLSQIFKIERKANIYKSIIVIIEYENVVVFAGGLNFDGIK